MADKTQHVYGADEGTGRLPSCDDSSINETNWREFQVLLNKSVKGGQLSSNVLVSTYSLMNTPIDVGTGTGNFNSTTGYGGITYIDYNNPCNLNGFITQLQITLLGATSTFYLGTFHKGIGNKFTVRAWTSDLSSYLTSAGTKTINGLHLGIYSGDYIGFYQENNSCVEMNSSGGSGVYYVAGMPSVGSLTAYTLWNAAYKIGIGGFGSALVQFQGGVLSPNGDIHFVPYSMSYGHKINYLTGVVSTYSLVYTRMNAYFGGVLDSNGDIHFVPLYAAVGQKISASGIVSTYSLVYTVAASKYIGGILAPNGDIHFVPYSAPVGQKISSAGVVSTYSLVYMSDDAYAGGVLASNGDIHFVPLSANRGQKISAAGVVSTYSLVYTRPNAYIGGVLSPNGDIHFVPYLAPVGQKISAAGVVSTYSLVYTGSAHQGGVLAPNGDIHFVPRMSGIGQKVDINGVVSTYTLAYTGTSGYYVGGVLTPNGDIYFIPVDIDVGLKISTSPAIPFSLAVCCSPFFNKF
jgi:hypothetical protein